MRQIILVSVLDSTNYKDTRLKEQMEWHSTKARHNKLRFRQFQIITLVASAIIPIINVVPIGGDIETR
jgi:hypothetical protein